ncbi:MAG: Ni/Fe hydrogenase subunit alpha [bacterium]
MKKLVIDPVSRIEGHGKVIVDIDENKNVQSARFQILEFRGFEKFCEGRPIWELPLMVTKICGICPVPHHLASVKACESALSVKGIPGPAVKLRKLMQAGADIADHALHFFYLALPDFILGHETPPENRSITEIISKERALAEKAILLRKAGTDIVEAVGGHSVYPVTAIPGGMSKPLGADSRDRLLKAVDQVTPHAEEAVKLAWAFVEKFSKAEEYTQKTSFMSLVSPDNALEHYDGNIRIISPEGKTLDEFSPEKYLQYIAEYVEDDSWCKFPYYRKLGVKDGVYRVGPLSRLNIAASVPTPKAAAWFSRYKEVASQSPLQNIFYYHLARCIELLHACEHASVLLNDKDITRNEVRVVVGRSAGEGVGVVEAPRGTLIHHYACDENGIVNRVNLIVPTTHNNLSINLAVTETARKFLKNGTPDSEASFRIETAVRAYDPCLSCATHEYGRSGLTIETRKKNG